MPRPVSLGGYTAQCIKFSATSKTRKFPHGNQTCNMERDFWRNPKSAKLAAPRPTLQQMPPTLPPTPGYGCDPRPSSSPGPTVPTTWQVSVLRHPAMHTECGFRPVSVQMASLWLAQTACAAAKGNRAAPRRESLRGAFASAQTRFPSRQMKTAASKAALCTPSPHWPG